MVAIGNLKKDIVKKNTGLSSRMLDLLLKFFNKNGNSKDEKTGIKWTEHELYAWARETKNSREFREHVIELDVYTEDILREQYELYNEYCGKINMLNKVMKKRSLSSNSIRRDNFPSAVSENIAKFAIIRKYGKKHLPTWQCDGDLESLEHGRLEVKGFSSTGPISFGPTEKWDIIYFVDCRSQEFIVYELRLPNTDSVWRRLRLSACQTFDDQCVQGKRPRHAFDGIKKQLRKFEHPLKIIFKGTLDQLFEKSTPTQLKKPLRKQPRR